MRNGLSRAGLSLALAATLVGPVSAKPPGVPRTAPGELAVHAGSPFASLAPDGPSPRPARAGERARTTVDPDSPGTPPAAPGARPDAPSGLLANVYSRTAAGLRWDRRGAPGERYEVRRDGESVAFTDGTSHVARDLSPERRYLFEVIAVDRTGRRSAAARLSLVTASGSRTPPLVAGPAVPDGLRAVAYSPTAGGISWRRPSAVGLRYEVRRDGRVLADTDGTSHVDDDLAAGRSYAYAVTAIDGSGRRSVAARIALDTPAPGRPGLADVERPDPAAASVYARLGAARTVALARHWLEGAPPFALLGSAQRALERLLGELRETVLYPDEGTPYALSCPDGGRAEIRTGYPYSRLTLSGCRTAGLELSGEASRFAYGGSRRLGADGTVGFTYEALLVRERESGASVLATGREERTRHDPDPSCRRAGPAETVSRELIDTTYAVGGEETRYERYETVPPDGRTARDAGAPGDADPTCTATRAADVDVSARVTSPLIDGHSVALRAGSSRGALPLHVRFDDGTTLRLDRADDGTDDLRLDVDGDGSARSYVLRDEGRG